MNLIWVRRFILLVLFFLADPIRTDLRMFSVTAFLKVKVQNKDYLSFNHSHVVSDLYDSHSSA